MIPEQMVEAMRQRVREVVDAHPSGDFRVELSYREVEYVADGEPPKVGKWVLADTWQRAIRLLGG